MQFFSPFLQQISPENLRGLKYVADDKWHLMRQI